MINLILGSRAENTARNTQSPNSSDEEELRDDHYTSSDDEIAGKADPLASQNTSPCPTLFVDNLGPRYKEKELIQVFSRCRGFIKLRVQSNHGTPLAFVDFEDTTCSIEALYQLQGAILYSSAGEGMRIEYAKVRMGMRKKPK